MLLVESARLERQTEDQTRLESGINCAQDLTWQQYVLRAGGGGHRRCALADLEKFSRAFLDHSRGNIEQIDIHNTKAVSCAEKLVVHEFSVVSSPTQERLSNEFEKDPHIRYL